MQIAVDRNVTKLSVISSAYTCTHVTKPVTTLTMAICANIHRVHSMLNSCTTTTSELTGPQSLDGGFLSEDEDELDPLEYAESTAPPQQGRHVHVNTIHDKCYN